VGNSRATFLFIMVPLPRHECASHFPSGPGATWTVRPTRAPTRSPLRRGHHSPPAANRRSGPGGRCPCPNGRAPWGATPARASVTPASASASARERQ
jgi:hypothetical protein